MHDVALCLVVTRQFHFTALDHRCQDTNAKVWSVWLSKGVFEKINDDYLWNSMWAIFSITTTVGYGDALPTTHCARFVAAIASLGGTAMT